jgi:DNA-binding NtrC family response regulator
MEFAHQYTISAVDIFYGYENSFEAGSSYHLIIDRTAALMSPVVISGESGLLKESVLRTIHDHSPRSKKACLSISPGLLPALTQSGFHGSTDTVPTETLPVGNGFFKHCNGCSLILSRLHEFTAEEQALIVSMVSSGQVDSRTDFILAPYDIRLMCSSLPTAIHPASALAVYIQKAGGSLITVLPLRSTPEDIPRLSQKILHGYTPRRYFGENVLAALRNSDWRLNLVQLKKAIQRMHASASGDIIEIRDLKAALDEHS